MYLVGSIPKFVWSVGVAIGLYFAAAPLVLVATACLFIIINRRHLSSLHPKKETPSQLAILAFALLLGLSYLVSTLVNFREINYGFIYGLAYGPALVLLCCAGYLMQKKLSDTLMLGAIVVLLIFQIVFVAFYRDVSIVRELVVGQLIFLPVVFSFKAVGQRTLAQMLFVLLSGVVAAFSDQRSFLVAIAFELIALNLLMFGRRSLVFTIIFALGFFVGGVVYIQSAVGGLGKFVPMAVPAISKRVAHGNPYQFTTHAGHLLLNYSDRLELYSGTFEAVRAHSFFGFSKQIPFEEVIMNSGAPIVERYKQIDYVPSHPHNFFLRAYYDIGWPAVIYILFLFAFFFLSGSMALSVSIIAVYGVYGLVESPTPFYLFFLAGIIAANSVGLKQGAFKS